MIQCAIYECFLIFRLIAKLLILHYLQQLNLSKYYKGQYVIVISDDMKEMYEKSCKKMRVSSQSFLPFSRVKLICISNIADPN